MALYSEREHKYIKVAYFGLSIAHICILVWHYYHYAFHLKKDHFLTPELRNVTEVKCRDLVILRRDGELLLSGHQFIFWLGIILCSVGPFVALTENLNALIFLKALKTAYYMWFVIRSAGHSNVLVPVLTNLSGALVLAGGVHTIYLINLKRGIVAPISSPVPVPT